MLKKCLLSVLFATLFLSQVPAASKADTKYASSLVGPEDFRDLTQSPVAVKVAKVIDPLTFMGEDKNIYALSGLEVPNRQTGKNDITLEATKALAGLIENKDLILYVTKNRERGRLNRMSQSVVQAELKQDRIWIEGEMLAEGLARVRTTPSNPEMIESMLKIEQAARDSKRGLWADPAFQVLNADTVIGQENSFAIVEATPKAAAITRNMIFLNFSDDYRKDFTVGIPSELRVAFAKKSINPLQLAHVPLRIRGWVQSYNGPFIEIDHPEQIEILGHLPVFTSILPPASEPSPGNIGMRTIAAPIAPKIAAPVTPDIKKPDTEKPNKNADRFN